MRIHIKSRKSKKSGITPFLSIVIPAYNEEERIAKTLIRIDQYLSFKKYAYEIIVVDDGSSDNTVALVSKLSRKVGHISILKNKKNRGKGFAVRTGMRKAQGRIRLFMDADNSVDISHLDEFIRHLESGFDIVIGSIKIGEQRATERNGIHRRILGSLANFLIRALATPKIKDTQRGFKLFSARAAKKIFSRQTINRFGFDIELLVIARKNGYQIKEIPVVWDNPAGSKVGLSSYVFTLIELLRITLNRAVGKYNF
ncbi:hypothetical protein A2W48_01785 [Candidatus Giovannonibacteria bacterium RIFCSPHIGHO2_12_44_12]|uniref:dolichyl-phosphate beta-glucosyltransferase n=1 Tax=Candidatus Giovannonibacteria bacterium RIFCSPHIGHO2_12_44_12 TaxID=1798340 RepID=A0A1F5WZ16_9BACT|nr:MAG: hypothetical protein A2W48_01785 [Candidatus Giovannonibacteria bacterium RIFCSPHIGHO2_12_44_12]